MQEFACTSLLGHVKSKIVMICQHPAHHAEEADEVGLSRAVGADEHGEGAGSEAVQLSDGLESAYGDGVESVSHGARFSAREDGRWPLPTHSIGEPGASIIIYERKLVVNP